MSADGRHQTKDVPACNKMTYIGKSALDDVA